MKGNVNAELVIDGAMSALGLSYDMTTDLSIVREVLREMKVDDFKTTYQPMKEFLDQIVSEPCDLGGLLAQVRWGLSNKEPAVVEFLSVALGKEWLTGSPDIDKAVHVAYLLEAITAAMCNSAVFFDEYVEHIREKEKDVGIDHAHLFKSFLKMLPGSLNFFGSAKAISLDMAMVYFRVGRYLGGGAVDEESIDELYAAGTISSLEHKLLMPLCEKDRCVCNDWLRINIYEAGITEYKNGFHMNAMAAHVLAEDVMENCHRESFQMKRVAPQGPITDFYASLLGDDNYFPVIGISDSWKSLYLTWNMAFILGELNNLHYLFPKLLIPSVLCANNENFLGARIISLWVSINSAVLLNFHDVAKLTAPEHRREMSAAWGKINRRHAEEFYKASLNSSTVKLLESFEERFAQPYRNLAKQIIEFMKR